MLWVVQIALAVVYVAGGAYKLFAFDEVARTLPALPHPGWRAFGAVEVIGGLMLVVPAVWRGAAGATPRVAAILTAETLVLAAIYASYSRAITAANPLVWAVVMAALAAIVASGRSSAASAA